MTSLYDRFGSLHAGRHETYFAGANSGDGFVSDYDRVLCEERFERVYIIKGGPGVGKSTAIRRCSEAASLLGADVVEYRCGSDADSLDLAVIEKDGRKTAVLDGTAPHTRDPGYPGAAAEIVDFGRAWSRAKLEGMRDIILDEAKKKADAFADAYRLLAAAKSLRRDSLRLVMRALDKAKMHSAAVRLLKKVGAESDGGSPVFRYADGITMKGAYSLDTPEKIAAKTVYVSDDYMSGTLLIAELYSIAAYERIGAAVFVSPLDPELYRGIYLSSCGVYFGIAKTGCEKCAVNMMRFLSPTALAEIRGRRRASDKLALAAFDEALVRLGEAREHHFALEGMYGSATDYGIVDELTSSLAADIAERLK